MLMNDTVLINFLDGTLTQEECTQVEAWVEESAQNRKVLEALYYALFVGDRQTAMRAVDVEGSLAELKKRIGQKEAKVKKRIGWKRYATSVAAFVAGIVVTGVASWLLYANHAEPYLVFTEAGQRAQVLLPDGTRAWLNASTQLAYKKDFWNSQRRIDLVGEAYFEVARNEAVPFTVNSQGIRVRVLGTQFNVRAHPTEERVVTTLLGGSVQIGTPDPQKDEFLLTPGQTLDVNTKSYQSELMEYDRPKDVLLWINGKLRFEQATLEEIVSVLEKHFDIRFVFDSHPLKSERYTCEFSTDDDVDKIIKVLSLTNRFTYREEGKRVHLKNKE